MHREKGKYDIGEQIYASPNSILYAAVDRTDGRSVILKTVSAEKYHADGIAKLQGEYRRMSRIEDPQVLRPLDFVQQDGTCFLVLERFEGATLSSYISFNTMSPEQFLHIAIQIVKGLAAIHKQGMIHKDINPSNILYNPQTGEVKITDFGIATEYQFERNDEMQINMGTLKYISPEQTRRMNRSLDFRTDFYSMGITFYEMICGRVPFDSDSPMGLIYAHLAKLPQTVYEIRPEIPQILSKIIARLMEKMPEDRYVSDGGILYDLEQCIDLLDVNGNIVPFTLGSHDRSEQLEISKRIYGRDNEINRLHSIFEEFMIKGQSLLTIGGYSGTGKTSLVNQLHCEIAEKGGLFLEGKFDQYQQSIPYYAFFKAIEQLCDMILCEPESRLERWRRKLSKGLGQDGELLARRLPKVAHLLEIEVIQETEEEKSASVEERIRFKGALIKLFRTTAAFMETLVLFLDDIHLADMASLEILEELMMNDEIHGLFVIACFRDNETSGDHPLLHSLQKIQFRGGHVKHISLKGIEQNAVLELIADSLKCSISESDELAEVVFEKTRGNPFYVIQMLRHCYAQGLISFRIKSNSFVYDIKRIRQVPFEENVVDFLIHQAKELPADTVKLLSMGAVVGQRFDWDILAFIADRTAEEVKEQLKEAVSLEIISPRGLSSGSAKTEIFTFCHDRFQQAYYTMLEERERLQSHLKISAFYEQQLSGEALSAERILKIAENYTKGLPAIIDKLERGRVANIVLEAVHVSFELSAFDTAMRFIEILLIQCKDVQNEDEAFMFSLYASYHATLCSLARYDEADIIYEKLKTMMKVPLDMTEVCCDQAIILSNRGQYMEAIALGIRFLEACGIHYPRENLKEAVEEEVNAYYEELNDIGFQGIEGIGETDDPVQYAVNKVANRIFAASLFGNPLDSFWLAMTTSRRILKNGYTPDGLQLYANQVVPLVFLRGDYRTSCLATAAATKIAEEKNYRNVIGRFYHCYSLLCNHWDKGLHEGLAYARSAFEKSVEVGDFEMACYSFCTAQGILLETSNDIEELHLETNMSMAFARKHNNNHGLQIYTNYEQLYKSLKGQTEGNGSFNDQEFQEDLYLQSIAENGMAIFFYKTLRALSAVLFEELETAYMLTEQAILYEPFVTGFYVTAQRRFLHSLAICGMLAKENCEQEEGLLEKLLDNRKWLQARALDAPINFEHMYWTVEAGLAALENRDAEALMWFNKAAGASKNGGFTCHTALIMELAGKHLTKMNTGDIASLYIKEACLKFITWGAVGKAEQMKQLYPEYLLYEDTSEKTGNNKAECSMTGSLTTVTLDLDAIIKASQTITKEIHLEDILKQLMSVLLENAGAQDIYFLTEKNGDFEIRAQGHGRKENPTISTEITGVELDLPYQILNYVFRTGESVVLESIKATDRFGRDKYFEEHSCKSVMCLPVVNTGKLKGILYLENNIIEGAFRKDRVDFLNVLTAQLGISLENALLYDNIYKLAFYDNLTSLPNRAAMYKQLAKWTENYITDQKRYAVLLIDLDNFKAINDTFGHTFGDMLLQKLGLFLKNFAGDRGIVSRIGGDEFLIAVTKEEWVDKAQKFAKELLNKLSYPLYVESIELHISISIGIAVYPENGENLETLMRNADTALYSAKEDGKNTYKRFSEEMQSKTARRLEIENKLRRAIRNQEFIVYYQPKVDGQTGKTVGAEALVRWNSPALGVVLPIQFISVAEDSGVIIPIDEIVMVEACKMAKSLQDEGVEVTISVNKSAAHFKKKGLVDRIRSVLEQEKLSPGLLEIEITESAAMQDLELTIGILDELRSIGIKVSLDDFGTGYSSLSHLRQLPITTLKIDKSFIDGVGAGQNESSIVESLIDLAHKIHLTVVAEGVENKEQFEFLKKNCCDLIQGYYFSKPLSKDEFLKRLLREKDSKK